MTFLPVSPFKSHDRHDAELWKCNPIALALRGFSRFGARHCLLKKRYPIGARDFRGVVVYNLRDER